MKNMKAFETKIFDLSNFINSLTRKKHEILLGVDTNEPNVLYNNGVSQLLQRTILIDIINENYGLYKVYNKYLRGRHRIDYFFYTDYTTSFIDISGITSFNEATSSNHQGIFIDLRLKEYSSRTPTL